MQRRSMIIAVCVVVAGALSAILIGDRAGPGQTKQVPPLALDGAAALRPWTRYADPSWPRTDFSKFNTLADAGLSPPAPRQPRARSGPITGDAANGQKLVADRTRGGSCLACHVMGPAGGTDRPGNVGP